MSETHKHASETVQSTSWQTEPAPTAWVGWIAFAATMMLLLGVFHVIQGLIALFDDQYYVVGQSGLVVQVDYTTWGWAHLILGALIVATGLGLMVGQMWARVTGVVLMFISAIVNIGFLAAYPAWSVIMIAVDVLVIWAVLVHGREMKAVES